MPTDKKNDARKSHARRSIACRFFPRRSFFFAHISYTYTYTYFIHNTHIYTHTHTQAYVYGAYTSIFTVDKISFDEIKAIITCHVFHFEYLSRRESDSSINYNSYQVF